MRCCFCLAIYQNFPQNKQIILDKRSCKNLNFCPLPAINRYVTVFHRLRKREADCNGPISGPACCRVTWFAWKLACGATLEPYRQFQAPSSQHQRPTLLFFLDSVAYIIFAGFVMMAGNWKKTKKGTCKVVSPDDPPPDEEMSQEELRRARFIRQVQTVSLLDKKVC